MLKCFSQPQLEKFARSDSGYSCCDANDIVASSPTSVSTATEVGQLDGGQVRRTSSLGEQLSRSVSTACFLNDCMLGSLTKDTGSNVGLDHKIEQAMDLVKGHLMFAVREEIDVLKEQIKNLVARNAQLEHENAFLTNHASPETLAQLQSIRQSPPHNLHN